MRRLLGILFLFSLLPSIAQDVSKADSKTILRFRQLQSEDPTKAEAFVTKALKEKDSIPIRYELALFYASQSQETKAVKEFDAVFKKNNHFPGAGRNLSILLMRLRMYPRAIEVMGILAKRQTLGGDLSLLQGKAYSETGKHLAALQCFRNALPAFPDQTDLKLKIASTLFHLKRYEEASTAALSVIKENATLDSAWVIRGNASLKQGKNSLAIDCFEAARLINPTLNKALLPTLGDLYLSKNLPKQAAACYTKAGAKRTDRLLGLARAFYIDGDLKASARLVDDVLKNDPKEQNAQLLAALLTFKKGNLDKAHSAMVTYVKKHPLDGEALVTLAEIETARKRYNDAISWYRSARQSAKWKRYAMESELDLYLQQDDTDSALHILRTLKRIYPSPQWDELEKQLRAE